MRSNNSNNKELNRELVIAIIEGKDELCFDLISQGADINYLADPSCNTPAHYAAAHNNLLIYTYLIDHPTLEPKINVTGYTYLHTAAYFGSDKIVEYIINKGGNIKALTNKGKTPLDLVLTRIDQLTKVSRLKPNDVEITRKLQALNKTRECFQAFLERENKEDKSRLPKPPAPSPSSVGTSMSPSQEEAINYIDPSSMEEVNIYLNGKASTNIIGLSKLPPEDVTDELLKKIVDKSPNLTHLDLSGCYQITDAGIKYLAQKSPNLETLSIFGCSNITDNAIASLVNNNVNLKCLILSCCEKITDQGIGLIARGMSNISSLHIAFTQTTDAGIESIISNCNNLTKLNSIVMTGCKNIQDRKIFKRLSDSFPNAAEIILPNAAEIILPVSTNEQTNFAGRVKASKNTCCVIA